MAREPLPPLSEAELERLRRSLASFTPAQLTKFYKDTYESCKLGTNGSGIPDARQIQTLVQVWREMWKWRDGKR
jgi:hypothetical protein